VVRGADLLLSTPRQLLLQQRLGLSAPVYRHLPVAVNRAGEKLSKQTHAAALDEQKPGPTLWQALSFLRQTPPEALQSASIEEIWAWAVANWRPSLLTGVSSRIFD